MTNQNNSSTPTFEPCGKCYYCDEGIAGCPGKAAILSCRAGVPSDDAIERAALTHVASAWGQLVAVSGKDSDYRKTEQFARLKAFAHELATQPAERAQGGLTQAARALIAAFDDPTCSLASVNSYVRDLERAILARQSTMGSAAQADPMDLQPEPHPPHRTCDCAGCLAYWAPQQQVAERAAVPEGVRARVTSITLGGSEKAQIQFIDQEIPEWADVGCTVLLFATDQQDSAQVDAPEGGAA